MAPVKLNKENMKFIGRIYLNDGMIMLAHSGTGVAFNAGKGMLKITFGSDTSSFGEDETCFPRIGIYVNDVRIIDDIIDIDEKSFSIDSIREDSVVQIIKLSESQQSVTAIKSIEASQEISPVSDLSHLIEFVGDSITCGYGIEASLEESFSTRTEDCTKAYAYKLAKHLGCDYSLVSLSGFGIISGYSEDGETRRIEKLFPEYYEQCGFSHYSYYGQYPQDVDWDFEKRERDLVVIFLGTNDISYCRNYLDRKEWFEEDYFRFIKTVREKNRKAKILCTLGTMGSELCENVSRAVNRYVEETKDTDIYYQELPVQSIEDGLAADSHPTERTNEKVAEILAKKINSILQL